MCGTRVIWMEMQLGGTMGNWGRRQDISREPVQWYSYRDDDKE